MKNIHFDTLLKNKMMTVLLSGLMLLAGNYVAQAQTASVSGSVNLRQGPGAKYVRIATLPRGASVHIDYCRGGWCQVRSSWGIGWVSSRYLLQGYNSAPAYSQSYPVQPQVTFGLNIGSGFYDDGGYYDSYYRPYYRPYDRPWYRPGYRSGFRPGYRPYGPRYNPRPYGREGWNPRWGVGPAHFPDVRRRR